jgi:hypothetical protein
MPKFLTVRFEVLTSVSFKITVVWNVAPYTLVDAY